MYGRYTPGPGVVNKVKKRTTTVTLPDLAIALSSSDLASDLPAGDYLNLALSLS